MLLGLALGVGHAGWRVRADLLVPLAVCASLAGALLAMSRIGILVAFPVSAVLGAILVLLGVGSMYHAGTPVADVLVAVRGDVIAWLSTIARGHTSASTVPYTLAFAVAMWVTGFVAGYALYRRHRAADAVLVVGVPFLASASTSPANLLWYGVPLVAAALLLRLHMTSVARASAWQARRLLGAENVELAVVRVGMLLTALIVSLSVALTALAVGHPLRVMWSGLADTVQSIGAGLAPWLTGIGGGSGGGGAGFSSNMTVTGRWNPSNAAVLTVTERGGTEAYYLAAVAYDHYTGHGWSMSSNSSGRVDPYRPLFPGDAPGRPTEGQAYRTVTVQIRMASGVSLRDIVVPVSARGGGFPTQLSVAASVTGPSDWLFGRLDAAGTSSSADGYTVTAQISSPTEPQLAAAGPAPRPITLRYLGDVDQLSRKTRDLALSIASKAAEQDLYHRAVAILEYLQALGYSSDPGQPSESDQDLVDYLLFHSRAGYCEYFATAMAMMARAIHIPSRVVIGYRPPAIADPAQPITYRESNRHAWAELYFSGYGWRVFDATPTGGGAQPEQDSVGRRSPAEPSPRESASGRGPSDTESPATSESSAPAGNQGSSGALPGLPAPVLVVVALLFLASLAAIAARWRHRRHGGLDPPVPSGERQWLQLLRAAGRAGVRPVRAETDYEYAAWLEEQIPARAPEIRTMADARVWSRYSGRPLAAGASHIVDAAWRRVRSSLRQQAVWRLVRRLLEHR